MNRLKKRSINATLLTWLPLIMPQELQGGVPNAELDCVYPLAAEKTVI